MLIVEDGTIVPGANSYVTRAEYIAYSAQRGVVIEDADDADVELTTGMDYVETQRFIGERVQTGLPRSTGFSDDWGYSDFYNPTPDVAPGPEQPCQWPRFGLYLNDDLPNAVYTIPLALKRAQMQVALDVHNGFNPFVNIAAGERIVREKIGPIDTTYATEQRTIALMPIAMSLLRPLLIGGAFFGATTFRV